MFLRINIGGRSFVIKQCLLLRARDSFLAKFVLLSHVERLKQCEGFLDDTNEYFFERSASLAEPIIIYYQSGIIYRPDDVCPIRFADELCFWGVGKIFATKVLSEQKSSVPDRLETVVTSDETGVAATTLVSVPEKKSIRELFWNMTENAGSGKAAKLFAILSAAFVLISVAGLILSSMEEFEDPMEANELDVNTTGTNSSNSLYMSLVYSEYACIAWFTFEFALRLCVSPDKLQFFKSPLNVIDVLTIVPFYVELSLSLLGIDADKLKGVQGTMSVARFARTLRVCRSVRIFKLARYSKSMMVFGNTLRRSVKELSMLFMLLITAIIFFSTMIYFLEKDVPMTKLNSIPAACWWGVVTVTTVGYGDVVPQTFGGKMLASLATVWGIVVLAFPISMMVQKFGEIKEELEKSELD